MSSQMTASPGPGHVRGTLRRIVIFKMRCSDENGRDGLAFPPLVVEGWPTPPILLFNTRRWVGREVQNGMARMDGWVAGWTGKPGANHDPNLHRNCSRAARKDLTFGRNWTWQGLATGASAFVLGNCPKQSSLVRNYLLHLWPSRPPAPGLCPPCEPSCSSIHAPLLTQSCARRPRSSARADPSR